MRSREQNNEWLNRIILTWDLLETPDSLQPELSSELARHVWESERSIIMRFRQEMIDHIEDQESLRKYLGFDLMDSRLWAQLATLIYSLIEREDITNLDFVIRRVTEFVQMCPYFYGLRFGPENPLRKAGVVPEKENKGADVTEPAGAES